MRSLTPTTHDIVRALAKNDTKSDCINFRAGRIINVCEVGAGVLPAIKEWLVVMEGPILAKRSSRIWQLRIKSEYDRYAQ